MIASHERPLRLRWLLNALEQQTLAPEAFEIVVVHDGAGPAGAETERLLAEHPLRGPGACATCAWRRAPARRGVSETPAGRARRPS